MHQEKLNPVEIAEAFPEECKKFLPKRRKEVVKELKPYMDLCSKVRAFILNGEAQSFWTKVIKQIYMPRELVNELAEIDLILAIASDKTVGGVSKWQIQEAKRMPIDGLHSFSRRKNTVKGFLASCPFGTHNDSTPSFNVRDNRFMCFGCGEKGDAIDFVSKLYNKSFLESVKWLIKK